MASLQQQIEEYRRKKSAEYEAVLAGGEPPPCYTCKAASTHVSRNITPAGYHSYQCAAHARDESESAMWGSDPGWPTTYETIAAARARTGSGPRGEALAHITGEV